MEKKERAALARRDQQQESQVTIWSNFYVIIGSAAAPLTGLMFAVITLTAHQQLLEGLGVAVAGLEQMDAALQDGAGQGAAAAYRGGVDVLLEGFATASAAIKKIDIVIAAARGLLR